MSENGEEAPQDLEEPEEPDADPTPDGEETDSDDEMPEITEEETASTDGLDLSDADLDPDPDGGSDGSASSSSSGSDSTSTTSTDSGDSEDSDGNVGGKWGEMYVSVLTQSTNRVIEKHGDEESETVDRDHFEEVELGRHFNETMQKFSGSDEMEPEEALVIGTVVGVAGPIALETDLLSQLKEEIDT
jgi:hypothetical protein